jgi:hypothetical protein
MPSDPQYYSHQVNSSTSHPLKHKISVAVNLYNTVHDRSVPAGNKHVLSTIQKEQGRQHVVER